MHTRDLGPELLRAYQQDSAEQFARTFVSVITDVKAYSLSQMIEGNRIAAVTETQYGLPDNKWPPAVLNRNDTSPGLTYDDATVLDGTNAWSVNSDRK